MLYEISNKQQLKEFASAIDKAGVRLVGLDGENGIGKSTAIAPILREALGGKIISVDDFLNKDKGGYEDYVNYDGLKNEIETRLSSGVVILEGVLLLKILERIALVPDKLYYATGEVWYLEWQDYDASGKTLDLIIQQKERDIDTIDKMLYPNRTNEYRLKGLYPELYRYTYDYKPTKRADSVFLFRPSNWHEN